MTSAPRPSHPACPARAHRLCAQVPEDRRRLLPPFLLGPAQLAPGGGAKAGGEEVPRLRGEERRAWDAEGRSERRAARCR